MQLTTCVCTQADDIACIRRYFGLIKADVEHGETIRALMMKRKSGGFFPKWTESGIQIALFLCSAALNNKRWRWLCIQLSYKLFRARQTSET